MLHKKAQKQPNKKSKYRNSRKTEPNQITTSKKPKSRKRMQKSQQPKRRMRCSLKNP
jgi:hypothetical protein